MLTRETLLTVAGVSQQPSSVVYPYSHILPRVRRTAKYISTRGGVSVPVVDLTKEQSAPGGEAPILLSNVPLSLSLNEGEDLFLSVSAYGSEPLSYQWKKDNVNIVGATSSAYQKLAVAETDEATYKCVVTNAYGTVTSHECVVAVVSTYTVDFVAGAGGTISGDASQTVTEGGDCSAVEAVPDEGYEFVDWTGDISSTDNPLTVENVVADMSITANFAALGPNMNVLNYYYNQLNG